MIIGLIVIAVVLILVVGLYNSLATSKVAIDEALSGIDVQLKRRADLTPNLVEVVKGYAKHEDQVFDKVMKSREKMMGASSIHDKAVASNELTSSLKSVFAIAEAYPDLKASTNFSSLQSELSDLEAKISYARQFYNSNVKNYNNQIVTFPNSILASMFSFNKAEFFEAGEGGDKPVEVKF
jgi:LemA protein